MIIPSLPGIVFTVMAIVLQAGEALDWPQSAFGPYFSHLIIAALVWVFVGPIVIGLGAVVGWVTLRRADPDSRRWHWILVASSVLGWVILAEFMRMG